MPSSHIFLSIDFISLYFQPERSDPFGLFDSSISVPVRPARPRARYTTAQHFILSIHFLLSIHSTSHPWDPNFAFWHCSSQHTLFILSIRSFEKTTIPFAIWQCAANQTIHTLSLIRRVLFTGVSFALRQRISDTASGSRYSSPPLVTTYGICSIGFSYAVNIFLLFTGVIQQSGSPHYMPRTRYNAEGSL